MLSLPRELQSSGWVPLTSELVRRSQHGWSQTGVIENLNRMESLRTCGNFWFPVDCVEIGQIITHHSKVQKKQKLLHSTAAFNFPLIMLFSTHAKTFHAFCRICYELNVPHARPFLCWCLWFVQKILNFAFKTFWHFCVNHTWSNI